MSTHDIHGGDTYSFRATYGREPLDFSASLSPLGMPHSVKEAAAAALEKPPAYPDPHCRELRKGLARHHKIPEGKIVCGAGAAELIWRIVRTLAPGKALLPEPTFTEYARALTKSGCAICPYPLHAPQFAVPEELLRALTPEIDISFLCEPNNPTGKLTDPALLREILERCAQTGTILVVDECFMEFVDEPKAHSLLPACASNEQLIVLRAFTKSFAMAALRLGYAVCGDAGLAQKLREGTQPWPVSDVAQAAGIAALKEKDHLDRTRECVRTGRRFLERQLASCGMTVIPSEANYLLFHSPDSALGEKLMKRGILIRDCASIPGLSEGWYRVAVKKEEENRILAEAIRAERKDHAH